MRKIILNKYKVLLLLSPLILVVFTLILLPIYLPKEKKLEIRSKAAGLSNTISVPEGGGATTIQTAIDSAKDGDTIVIPPGSYSGPIATPIRQGLSGNRGAAAACFLQIENKKITIKGAGATLYGEGHDKPNTEPYATRAGICVYNSQVTFEGLRLKEFQSRAMIVYNSQIIYRNGIVDGNDGGGISMLGDSKGVYVNNSFAEMNSGGVMLWQNSQAAIINNNFYNAAILYFYHPGTNDQARADIINNIFSEIKSDIAQVGWWKADPAQLKLSKLSYNIVYRTKDFVCDPGFELWCDDFPGKIIADPMYNAPVTDPRGIAAWADFALKEGSPAIGIGDSTIPGPKNLGVSGGPCTDPNSSICSSFISQQLSQLAPPASPTPIFPTSAPTVPIPTYTYPTSNLQPTNPYQQQQPPITYYLPPTVAYEQPNVIYQLPAEQITPTLTPTITPTIAPIIDIQKTIKSAKSNWDNFVTAIIRFTQTILP